MMSERKRRTVEAYNDGRIKQDVFGQLAMFNFGDEIFEEAVEREWITKELACELMEGNKEETKMTVKELRAKAKEMGIKGYSRMTKEQLHKEIEGINNFLSAKGKKILMRAFTGMVIGEFEVTAENEKEITVQTKKGELSFNIETGLQVDPKNPKFANKFEWLAL